MVDYSYDDTHTGSDFNVYDRYMGDVEVTVQGQMKVLTPVLGVTADHMKKTLTSRSVFKVEVRSDAVDEGS